MIGKSKSGAVRAFLEFGVTVVPGCVPDEVTSACAARAASDLRRADEEIARRLASLDATSPGAHHEATRLKRCDFAECVRRDGGRVDLRLGCGASPYDDASISRNPFFLPVVRELLGGGDVTLLYAGVMVARKGETCPQKWHKDGDHLFPEGDIDAPPHAITVFVPLADLTVENGPTEFRLGSQRRRRAEPEPEPSGARAKRPRPDEVAVDCARGSALLFDYRVDHRGLANVSDRDRLVLFLGYSRPWFRDTKNTRSKVPLFPDTYEAWVPRSVAADGEATLLHGDDSGERFELFDMAVALGENTTDTIRVHDSDDPDDLAAAFCAKHALPAECASQIADSIRAQMRLARPAT